MVKYDIKELEHLLNKLGSLSAVSKLYGHSNRNRLQEWLKYHNYKVVRTTNFKIIKEDDGIY